MHQKGKIKRYTIDGLMISFGALLAGFGLEGFLIPNRFIDGGVTGVAMLVSLASGLPIWVGLIFINLPFVWIGARAIGRAFAVRSVLAIALLAVAVVVVPYPVVTQDNLLAAAFGGVILGLGVGFIMRGGGVSDGLEAMAILISRRTGLTVGDVILGLNILIFSGAAILVGLPSALYSILTYFAASKMVDFVIHGFDEYVGVVIMSPENDEIKYGILHELGAGVTIYKGESGYAGTEQNIIFCVVTRLEIHKIKSLAYSIDEHAFIHTYKIDDAAGGFVKQKKLH